MLDSTRLRNPQLFDKIVTPEEAAAPVKPAVVCATTFRSTSGASEALPHPAADDIPGFLFIPEPQEACV